MSRERRREVRSPKSILFRTITLLLFAVYVGLTSTFLLFTVLEFVPSLAKHPNLRKIRYYAQRKHWQPDSSLVFIPSRARTWSMEFTGDLYAPDYGVPRTAIPYHATYTADGFRANSSSPPFEIVLIGDSYVEIGEADRLTLSEQLAEVSGARTFNLGREWYGPFQYLELYKRYAVPLKPRYAVLCFFDGNDVEDTTQYLSWRNGGSYYSFVFGASYVARYFMALRDSYEYLSRSVNDLFGDTRSFLQEATAAEQGLSVPIPEENHPAHLHPDVGLIILQDAGIPMRFKYWNQPLGTAQLLESEEWQAIRQVLNDFRQAASDHGTVPVALFIPKKVEVYGAFHSRRSGEHFRHQVSEHLRFENNSHDAFMTVAEQAGIHTVDLLPVFRRLAREGKVLYYPFDTHWNPLGRRTAAEILAASLAEPWASAPAVCAECGKEAPAW
jgi:hypothetical protein